MTIKFFYSPSPSLLLGYDVGASKKEYPKIRIRSWNNLQVDPFVVDELNQGWRTDEDLRQFKHLAKELTYDLAPQFRSKNTRAEHKYIHLVFSFSPADRDRLSKEDPLIVHIAEDVLQRLELKDYTWLLTEHLDTHHPHLHIAVNRIGKNGKAWSDSMVKLKCRKIALDLDEKYRLSPPNPTLQNPEKQSQATKDAELIRAEIKAALKLGLPWEEFIENLEDRGINVHISANGISFGLKGKNGGFKGYKLGFAYPKLRKMVDEAYTETIAATIHSTFEPLKKSIASTIAYFKEENNEGRIEGDAHEQFRKLGTCWLQVEKLKETYERVNPCVADRLISALHQAIQQLVALLQVLVEQLKKWYRSDLKEASSRLKEIALSVIEFAHGQKNEDIEAAIETLNNTLTILDKKQKAIDKVEAFLLQACRNYSGESLLQLLQTNHIEVHADATLEHMTTKTILQCEKILSPPAYNEVITAIKKALAQKAITPPHHRLGRHL